VKTLFKQAILITGLLLSTSCHSPTGPTTIIKLNPYLKEINFSNPKQYGNIYMAIWRKNTIFAIQQLSKFVIDDNDNVIQDTVLLDIGIYEKFWTYIDANIDGSKLLLVATAHDGVSAGSLYEYDVLSGQLQLLFDQTRNVASARYYPKDNTKVVYYSFGDNMNIGAGYYLYDKSLGQDRLLFPYLSSAGWWETLHGFDVDPNGDKLLIPISQAIGQFDHSKPPKLGIVSLLQQKLDTLSIDFNFSFDRTGLWVRYNHDGSKILYCCFPDNAYGFVANDNSEVGIIDASTLTKNTLNVNTNDESKYGSVQLAPNWSPDETEIVFGSGQVISSGQAGMRMSQTPLIKDKKGTVMT
jgi:hypothetical protein